MTWASIECGTLHLDGGLKHCYQEVTVSFLRPGLDITPKISLELRVKTRDKNLLKEYNSIRMGTPQEAKELLLCLLMSYRLMIKNTTGNLTTERDELHRKVDAVFFGLYDSRLKSRHQKVRQ